MSSRPPKITREQSGHLVTLYEREGRWFAGLPVTGWRPYADIAAERERREAKAAERRATAAGLAPFTVDRAGQLCSGGREPIERGARAYEDRAGWVYCPAHIPEQAEPYASDMPHGCGYR